MKLLRLVTGWASVLMMAGAILAAAGPAEWDQPAGALAEQISGVLGPGQATLILRNLSSIAEADVPAIRALLEKDLKAHGVTITSGDSANTIRITLSQNDRERLWVAEIVEGNETRVVMAPAGPRATQAGAVADYMTLRRERLPILQSVSEAKPGEPVLASIETSSALFLLRPETLDVLVFAGGGWQHHKSIPLADRRQLARDAHGMVVAAADSFTAYAGQAECSGTFTTGGATPGTSSDNWTIGCHASDEPWPIAQNNDPAHPIAIKAFYNAARNYLTGVITPSLGVDLPPFYSAALLTRPNGPALLIGGIDGKVQVVDNGVIKPVSGARDWGSDFAVLKSGCGSGAQVIASGSGEAVSDSLRAYELPAQEAIPASAPLPMNGTVTALWPAPDGRSLLAAVRQTTGDYEVDRVSALCN